PRRPAAPPARGADAALRPLRGRPRLLPRRVHRPGALRDPQDPGPAARRRRRGRPGHLPRRAPPRSPRRRGAGGADTDPSRLETSMWPLTDLEREIDEVRRRIRQHRRDLSEFFVARGDEIELMSLSAAAQEPLLFVGPPGTAKSDLVIKFV